ncbi:pyridoxal-phosphate dependent enzyme, partial [Candidatus Thorarchaeota archaeon]
MIKDRFGFPVIEQAHQRIGQFVKKTALEYSLKLSEICNGEVYLKLENQQYTNSFKVRGALNKLAQLTLEQRRKGVVTASSGNHAQGVAFASRMLEIPATIFVPETVSTIKL